MYDVNKTGLDGEMDEEKQVSKEMNVTQHLLSKRLPEFRVASVAYCARNVYCFEYCFVPQM